MVRGNEGTRKGRMRMTEAPEDWLHACRTGRWAYGWVPAPGRRRGGGVGGFACGGCGVRGTCGACAEEDGRCVPPAHVPLLCRRHGGLDQMGMPPAIRAIAVGVPAMMERMM